LIETFFQHLLQAENAIVADHDAVDRALVWYKLGADFTHALHLTVCGSVILHTFDRGFCKQAREQEVALSVRMLTA